MLTARVDDTDKIIGLELGADDYISKPFNPREVVARVRSVLRRTQGGVAAKPARVLQMTDLLMDLDRHEVMLKGLPIDLTSTEFNILRVMLENPGYAFTRSELIEQGLGYEYDFYSPGPRETERTKLTHNIVLDLILRTGFVGVALFAVALSLSVFESFAA